MEFFVGEKCSDKFRLRIRLPRNSRDLLHAANLRHGTDGFTSPPKEGLLKIFSPLKIRRLRPGLNPRTWVPKASKLPLDHRSRFTKDNEQKLKLVMSDLVLAYSHIYMDLCLLSIMWIIYEHGNRGCLWLYLTHLRNGISHTWHWRTGLVSILLFNYYSFTTFTLVNYADKRLTLFYGFQFLCLTGIHGKLKVFNKCRDHKLLSELLTFWCMFYHALHRTSLHCPVFILLHPAESSHWN